MANVAVTVAVTVIITVTGNVMDDVGSEIAHEWVSLGEFSRRLGITRGATYGRIKRGTVEFRRKGNRGFQIAWPPPDHDVTVHRHGDGEGDGSGSRNPNVIPNDSPDIVAMRVEVARLEERLHAADRLLTERDARIADLQSALAEARRPWWRKLLG